MYPPYPPCCLHLPPCEHNVIVLIFDERTCVLQARTETVAPVHIRTALTYMRFTYKEVGLLINFNVAHLRDGITRLIQDKPVIFSK